MTSETGFAENVLKAFKSIIKEIEKGSSEHDIRYRFVKYFVEEVLGYEPKYIKWEKKRADLTIIDENDFAVIKIETKRPTESIDKTQHGEQAFKYEEEKTRFIGLTNFLQFKLWEVKKSGVVDIDAVLENEGTEKLHQLPKVSFNISDNAKFEKVKTEGSKVYVNSNDFIEIKNKKIKDFVGVYLNSNNEKLFKAKDVKNLILNIPVPKLDEVLKEIIKKGGADQSQIKEKIKTLEDEINELVYQIYGISEAENKVIEANL